jgi:hypothetical protein
MRRGEKTWKEEKREKTNGRGIEDCRDTERDAVTDRPEKEFLWVRAKREG